jgi:hypothetical protein
MAEDAYSNQDTHLNAGSLGGTAPSVLGAVTTTAKNGAAHLVDHLWRAS